MLPVSVVQRVSIVNGRVFSFSCDLEGNDTVVWRAIAAAYEARELLSLLSQGKLVGLHYPSTAMRGPWRGKRSHDVQFLAGSRGRMTLCGIRAALEERGL
jgi:hypothetical protein